VMVCRRCERCCAFGVECPAVRRDRVLRRHIALCPLAVHDAGIGAVGAFEHRVVSECVGGDRQRQQLAVRALNSAVDRLLEVLGVQAQLD